MTAHSSYLSTMFGLEGRVALVTGGSSGIGKAIAEALAAAGAHVVIIARDPVRLAQTVDAINAQGLSSAWVSGDIGSRVAVRELAEKAVLPFGEPDILVNCAGVNTRPIMEDIDDAVWDTTMSVNVRGPFLLGQRFGPGMAKRGFGRILHISSQQAHRAFVDSGVYGVSKGALESLSRSQAEAWSSSGVTSNTLVPGFVLTPLNERLSSDPARVEALARRTMVGRNGLASDFAGVAVFLSGDSSGYITGQSLPVDGGFSTH